MSNRPPKSQSDSRAEARRRARSGDAPDQSEGSADEQPSKAARPSLLASFFPPAPPLRGMPDPLARFTYRGPLRLMVSGLWLLAKHPFVWGAPALGWAFAQILLLLLVRHPLTFLVSVVQFVLLIGAGWIGWQRPWLFGMVGAMVGLFAYLGLVLVIGTQLAPADQSGWTAIAIGVIAGLGLIQPFIGAVAGFYGGYLRRRMQAPMPVKSSGRRSR